MFLRRKTDYYGPPWISRYGSRHHAPEKINSVADEAGGIIYARARLGAAALFYREGYEGLKKVAYDLKDFGVDDEGGKLKTKTAVFIFKRQPGAKSDRGRKLDLDFEKE
jgi:hypothetical protein